MININRDYGGMCSDYKGGSDVLNIIKSGVDFIIRKFVEYVLVGLIFIFLFEWRELYMSEKNILNKCKSI